ncbi:ATP-dependent DNA helicase Rep [Streptomyces glaucescens]
MDAADLRRLGRALREEERAAGNPVPPPSDVLLARALAEPERLVAHDPAYARGAQRLGALLRTARERLARGGTAEEALWDLWSGTPWPGRLERAARRGGAAGRNADRDLDAVCALFATAARAEERTGGRGALNFLEQIEAEDIAADTLTRRALRPDAVRLMTAHRAKGLEWRLVVVAGVQEGLWPDLRRRGSLLEADRIGRDGLAEPLTPGALLAEERRLFYVAATRARERLVVTAVKAPADDGDQPSRFLTELGVEPKDVTGRPRRPLSVAALVAELRATTVDPRVSEPLRKAAAHRLARLAALADEDGRPLVPSAHPYRWWGMFEPTESKVPLRHQRPARRAVTAAPSTSSPTPAPCSGSWAREVKALTRPPPPPRASATWCTSSPTRSPPGAPRPTWTIDWIADSIAHLVNTGKAPGEIAVLCRTATDFAEIQGALVARDVPVEVVGLSGLLHLPEVADLVAVCEVLQDPGANAALVRLLTGPRWRIGPRDLALLGRRARLLVAHARADAGDDPDRRLAEAVEGVDPAEVISLADALDTFLETPLEGGGDDDGLPFSPDARVRFARLAAELRDLRRSLSDPLMDVLHRVLAVTGLEVELSASPHALAARRRETLSNFLDVAASFAATESEASLLAFLGFLRTAAQYEKGLDNALPGGENTVKVLTAHRSKGLEWDVVAVPGLVTGTFPSAQGREKWTAQAKVLPHELRGDADTLPDVEAWDSRGMKAFHEAMKEHQHTEELRLGYVTFTRPRSQLLGSGHFGGAAAQPGDRRRPPGGPPRRTWRPRHTARWS